MIDLHSHILPGIDDGSPELAVSVDMARAYVADGVHTVACTPHILPGIYHNNGNQIKRGVAHLQVELDRQGIALELVSGADVHIAPNLVAMLKGGSALSLADTRYVLIEPPHHVAPPRLEAIFFDLLVAGFVPILTHPERLSWISTSYPGIQRMVKAGVWMQITAGSLLGAFGRGALYWSERMLDEGNVHILATDAHNMGARPPNLARGREAAAIRVGAAEAEHLVSTRPRGILQNVGPEALLPSRALDDQVSRPVKGVEAGGAHESPMQRKRMDRPAATGGSWTRRLYRIFA